MHTETGNAWLLCKTAALIAQSLITPAVFVVVTRSAHHAGGLTRCAEFQRYELTTFSIVITWLLSFGSNCDV